jgi:DNA repair exonuclease SbcCD nuclease subunit
MNISLSEPNKNAQAVKRPPSPLSTCIHEKSSNSTGLSLLAIGDPHFKLENLSETEFYITKITTIIKTKKPDYVVILGDLLHCHERVHTTVLNRAYDFIDQLRQLCPVYVLVGNHDYINNSQFLTSNHWMNAMKEWSNVEIVDTGKTLETSFGKLIFCPYVYPGKFEEALNIIDAEWKTARTIFCHQEFYGCTMGAMPSVDGDKWDINSPFVISGHVHDKQRVQENIFYTGSSIQHAFGESYDKTITMCYLGNDIRLEDIDLEMPKKKIIYMGMDQIDNFDYNKSSKNKIKITLSGTSEEFKTFRKSRKYKELVDQGVKIVYKNKIMLSDKTITRNETFQTILNRLVKEENNPEVYELYTDIFSN